MKKLLIAVLVLILLILLSSPIASRLKYYKKLPSKNFRDHQWRTGDLLICTSFQLAPFHQGHLALVVCPPNTFGQQFVWDLTSDHSTWKLQNLKAFIQRRKSRFEQVFARPIQTDIDSNKVLEALKVHKSVRYDFSCIYKHAMILLESRGIPTVPWLFFNNLSEKEHFYCSEIIIKILVEIGVLDQSCLQEDLLYPNWLLDAGFRFKMDNNYIDSPFEVLFTDELQ